MSLFCTKDAKARRVPVGECQHKGTQSPIRVPNQTGLVRNTRPLTRGFGSAQGPGALGYDISGKLKKGHADHRDFWLKFMLLSRPFVSGLLLSQQQFDLFRSNKSSGASHARRDLS